MSEKTAIVIPARLASERLPFKPLIEFAGVPMIIRVALTCHKLLNKQNVFVSTPDNEIIDLCRTNDIQVIKSSINAKSGTDRLVEFCSEYNYKEIINVQGDELLLTEDCLRDFITKSSNNKNCTIGVTQIKDPLELGKSSVVKVAHSNNKLIYASRSDIPSSAYSENLKLFKHTGLYKFTPESLRKFSSYKPGFLENIEKIEILRLIENRISVDIVELFDYFFTIDTNEDVLLARSILEK